MVREDLKQFRKEKADKLRYARGVDTFVPDSGEQTVAQEYLEKLKNNPDFIEAEKEYRSELKPGLEAHRAKIAEQLKRTEDPEKNRLRAIAELKAEMENIPTLGDTSNTVESKEQGEKSSDRVVLDFLSSSGYFQEKFPLYLEDSYQLKLEVAKFKETVNTLKKLFRQEYSNGLSLQDFYDKHGFFASENKRNEQRSSSDFNTVNIKDVEASINYNPGNNDSYSKTTWNEILQEKFGKAEIPKHIIKSKTNFHVGDFLLNKSRNNINLVTLDLSLNSKKSGVKETTFLGMSTGTKKVRKEFSTMSDYATVQIAKRFGAVPAEYSGPIKQNEFFGSKEINRQDDQFYYEKSFPVNGAKGVQLRVIEYKARNNGYDDPKCKTKFDFEKRKLQLTFSKEFFDDILKREIAQ